MLYNLEARSESFSQDKRNLGCYPSVLSVILWAQSLNLVKKFFDRYVLTMSALPNPVPPSRKAQRQSALAAQRAQRLSGNATKSASAKTSSDVRPASTKLWESGMVLGVNTVLISTAIVTFAHLVPHQLTQHAKLKQIRAEESSLAQDIQTLQQNYEQNMSPEAAQRVAQQQGNLMPANQVNVVLTHPTTKTE